jgi:hypothetical protein
MINSYILIIILIVIGKSGHILGETRGHGMMSENLNSWGGYLEGRKTYVRGDRSKVNDLNEWVIQAVDSWRKITTFYCFQHRAPIPSNKQKIKQNKTKQSKSR